MKHLAKYITVAASLSFVFTALQYESLTGLSSAWERPENRKLIEERLTLNHTGLQDGKPYFFEQAYKSNRIEIQKYSDAYQCQSGKDASKCRPASQL